ncbi:MAG: hypothetical protein MRZ79_11375 [Bacteroidia bacterium]|nr:hypothetical protein [Bacteroidia bacterium]
MRRILTSLSLCLGLVLLFAACNREPLFPVEPRIEVISISPGTVKNLRDSIIVQFRFEDGDGNIGATPEDDPNIVNLTLIDSRINDFPNQDSSKFIYNYRIPNLTQDTRNPSIQGEVTVKIDFTTLFSVFASSEQVRYQIKFYDRDGNLATPINGNEEAVFTDYIEVLR